MHYRDSYMGCGSQCVWLAHRRVVSAPLHLAFINSCDSGMRICGE